MSQIVNFQKKHGLYPDGILGPLTANKMQVVFNIKTDEALAHFLGQLAHETNNFKAKVESFNYRVQTLKDTFSFYRRNPGLADLHGRKRGQKARGEIIANLVYDDKNRSSSFKLGNTLTGDGWRFRGRGAIMITGRANYTEFFRWKCLPINTDPGLVATLYYWDAAIWFFETRNIWKYTDTVSNYNIALITKIINGGDNGLQHRKDLTYHFYKVAKR